MILSVASISASGVDAARFCTVLLALLVFAHIFGHLFSKLKLPRVAGEITGGLMLGPTVLGAFAPELHRSLFVFTQPLSTVYWLGLVALMFISGLEVQKSVTRGDLRIVLALIGGATILPCLAGFLAPLFYDFSPYMGKDAHPVAFQIIVAVSVAVTSIPVISRIFMELEIIDTRFAKLVLAAATIQDVLLWIALGIATGMTGASSPAAARVATGALAVVAVFVAFILMTRTLRSKAGEPLLTVSRQSWRHTFSLGLPVLAIVMNVNVALAAFLAGILLGTGNRGGTSRGYRLAKNFAMGVLIPVYFAIVGMKLDMINHFNVTFFLGFLALSTLLETIGSMLAVRLTGVNWLSSFNFGVTMNARGGPGIVVSTIALEAGIINESFYSTLVMTAVVTSVMTGCWLRFAITRGLMPQAR
jgi:Kef-type K+ transport system membrane component KefB